MVKKILIFMTFSCFTLFFTGCSEPIHLEDISLIGHWSRSYSKDIFHYFSNTIEHLEFKDDQYTLSIIDTLNDNTLSLERQFQGSYTFKNEILLVKPLKVKLSKTFISLINSIFIVSNIDKTLDIQADSWIPVSIYQDQMMPLANGKIENNNISKIKAQITAKLLLLEANISGQVEIFKDYLVFNKTLHSEQKIFVRQY